jgi:hypothetical protein
MIICMFSSECMLDLNSVTTQQPSSVVKLPFRSHSAPWQCLHFDMSGEREGAAKMAKELLPCRGCL